MASKPQLVDSAAFIRSRVAELREAIAEDPELRRRGGVVFPHDTIGANFGPICDLLEKSGNAALLTGDDVSHVADIGFGNGELAFLLANCGYRVTAVDYSQDYSQSPYIASQIARHLDLPVAIVDFSVDRPFTIEDLRQHCIVGRDRLPPDRVKPFDLIFSVGLLYHLKNPYGFIESLAALGRYCIIGTWMFTHVPPVLEAAEQRPLVYLLDDLELNGDPTNYWIFNDTALTRLFRRCSFAVLDRLFVANNPQGIGTPNRMDLLMRGFYLLHSS